MQCWKCWKYNKTVELLRVNNSFTDHEKINQVR